MIRLFGALANGKPTDIKIKNIIRELYEKGAFFVMKNLNKLSSVEYEEIKSEKASIEEIEEAIIRKNMEQTN